MKVSRMRPPWGRRRPDARADGRVLPLAAALGFAWAAAGCASSRNALPIRTLPLDGIEWRASGRVIRARPDDGWVILDCALPPAADEDVILTRNGEAVARVRATQHRRGALVAADILDGRPMAGDIIEVKRMKTENQP